MSIRGFVGVVSGQWHRLEVIVQHPRNERTHGEVFIYGNGPGYIPH
jgi:hypothetical protein